MAIKCDERNGGCGKDTLVQMSDGKIYCTNCKKYWELISYYKLADEVELR